MSRNITEILKNQKKKRILKEIKSDPKLGFIFTFLEEEQANYLNEMKQSLESDLNKFKAQIKNGYTPAKGIDYFDGEKGNDADEKKIIKEVVKQIKPPKDGKTPKKGVDYFDGKPGESIKGDPGKDADEVSIIKRVLNKIIKPKDGDTPVKGKDYFDGADGSPDEPEQIADKLNTLEEKVDIGVIKGLKNYFDNINKKIQEAKSSKGGGMGNPQHESFTLTEGQTSVTTGFNIAAQGRAIFKAAMNGSESHYGEHFTVSGKTISFPVDIQAQIKTGYIFDITYIRGG